MIAVSGLTGLANEREVNTKINGKPATKARTLFIAIPYLCQFSLIEKGLSEKAHRKSLECFSLFWGCEPRNRLVIRDRIPIIVTLPLYLVGQAYRARLHQKSVHSPPFIVFKAFWTSKHSIGSGDVRSSCKFCHLTNRQKRGIVCSRDCVS